METITVYMGPPDEPPKFFINWAATLSDDRLNELLQWVYAGAPSDMNKLIETLVEPRPDLYKDWVENPPEGFIKKLP